MATRRTPPTVIPREQDRVLDLRAGAHRAYLEALDDVDVVVNASGAEDPDLAVAATDRGVGFVDITATTSYAAALAQLEPAAPVLYDVGLAPGLTSILATALHDDSAAPGPIDVALMIGAGERHGSGATEWASGGSTEPTTATNTCSPNAWGCRCAPTSPSTHDPRPPHWPAHPDPGHCPDRATPTPTPRQRPLARRGIRERPRQGPVGPRPFRIVGHRHGRSAGRPCRDRTSSRRPSTLEHPRPHGHCRHRDDPPRPVTLPTCFVDRWRSQSRDSSIRASLVEEAAERRPGGLLAPVGTADARCCNRGAPSGVPGLGARDAAVHEPGRDGAAPDSPPVVQLVCDQSVVASLSSLRVASSAR
jgi:hypothetical protein